MTQHRQIRSDLIAGAAVIFALSAKSAFAQQAIERNLPPAPLAQAPVILIPNATLAEQDATPIGPALRAIVVLGPQDGTAPNAADGVDVSRVSRLRTTAGAFVKYLSRPISKQLIAQVETQIARLYRAKGFPFVSVSTPEQEITSGLLQIRVLEFHLGAKTAPGASAKAAPYIESRVRIEPDDAIDTGALAQDLDWLNRFPFHRTEAVFTPGTALGATDLLLKTTSSKPWSAYIGYSNAGSPLTGWDRYFAGVQAAVPYLHDALFSYQFTGSNDVVFDQGRPFSSASDPAYISHAGRLIVPTLPRQDIEASVSYVQSNEPVQDFLVRQTTYEATLAYRSALSNLWSVLPGEGVAGAEIKRQTSRTLFGGVVAEGASFEVFQITLGYAQQEVDALGRTSGELTLHISPGSVNGQNTDAVFRAFSMGKFDSARYAYLSDDLNRYTLLPTLLGLAGWGLSNTLIGQYAAVPLPLTEQIGLGNNSLARGYTLDDGAFDAGVVSRNELRAPAVTVLSRIGWAQDQLSPYAFVDAGYGRNYYTKAHATPVSIGLGADYQLAGHLSATLDGAWALRTVGYTRSGELRFESRVQVAF